MIYITRSAIFNFIIFSIPKFKNESLINIILHYLDNSINMTKRTTHSCYNLAEQASVRRKGEKEDDYEDSDIEIVFEKDVSIIIKLNLMPSL